MKKVIIGKKSKDKKKSKTKEKPDVLLPSLISIAAPVVEDIEPFETRDERDYLKEILKLDNYKLIKTHLIYFSQIFPIREIKISVITCDKCGTKSTLNKPINAGDKFNCPNCKHVNIAKAKVIKDDLDYKNPVNLIIEKYELFTNI